MGFTNQRNRTLVWYSDGNRMCGPILPLSPIPIRRLIRHPPALIPILLLVVFFIGKGVGVDAHNITGGKTVRHHLAQDQPSQAKPCPEYKDLVAGLAFTKSGEPI